MNALTSESSHADIVLVEAEGVSTAVTSKWKRRLVPACLLVVILTLTLLGLSIYFSRSPGLFDVVEKAAAISQTAPSELKRGYVTASSVYHVGKTLLEKPGGYLTNDLVPPSAILDNMPSWEFGVITELRDAVRSLRNDFSRAQSQSVEDRDLMEADSKFNFDHTRFMLPSTEDEYRGGLAALERYLNRLQNGDAQFHNRADNLNFYLSTVEKRLGSLSQRLSKSVRESYLRDLILTDEEELVEVSDPTTWSEIDNTFFEARGYVWALIHTLKGIQLDFDSVLVSKSANDMLERIVQKLENTQRSLMSPVILNSSGFGMLTNHSLVLASYISRANAALIDLRRMLVEG